jgi:BirA family biotin operon repressor/biotin-[acetyl-CoA-carboxylase] ligase
VSIEQRPLNECDLFPNGPLRRVGQRVFVHETIDSTNAFLASQASTAGDGAVVWAEFQSGGRGRLGRSWESPRGASVLMSVLLHEDEASPVVKLATPLGAVASCEAIEATTDCTPVLRWPNDIAIAGRKAGGVLAESLRLEGGPAVSRRAVVLGIGVNCLQQRAHFPEALRRTATSLECETRRPVDRAAVALALLAGLDRWLVSLQEETGAADGLRAAWRSRCDDPGVHARFISGGRPLSGTILDITDDGDVIVELDEGGRRCLAAATSTRIW